jgi:hypothetical protein
LLRWFWWRINAWCEVVAMVSSFATSLVFLLLHKNGIGTAIGGLNLDLPITILVTTICWVSTAFLGPQTDKRTLTDFYRKVRPFGPGWRRIRVEAGISEQEARATHENIPLALLGWVAGCTVIWSGLFMVGNFLYGRSTVALLLLAVFAVGSLALVGVINRLWSGGEPVEVTAGARSGEEPKPR